MEKQEDAVAITSRVPVGWNIRRDDLSSGKRIIVEDERGMRSVTEEAEPTLFRFFDAACATRSATDACAPFQNEAHEDIVAEMKRLHDALCFWLPQSCPELPVGMRERIASDAYLLVGYDDMPDPKSAEELGWIVTASGNKKPVQEESFAWAVFADNGNVIIWSKRRSEVEPVAAKYGKRVTPVIAINSSVAPVQPGTLDESLTTRPVASTAVGHQVRQRSLEHCDAGIQGK